MISIKKIGFESFGKKVGNCIRRNLSLSMGCEESRIKNYILLSSSGTCTIYGMAKWGRRTHAGDIFTASNASSRSALKR